jgi:phosphoribosyl-AMP cyclohydrolase
VQGEEFVAQVRFGPGGLVPCVVQDAVTGEVLMVAYGTAASLAATVKTGEAHFWSRSRGELWRKGGTSGNVQRIVELRLDCDRDTVLMRVAPAGPACHTGAASCFRDEANGGARWSPQPGNGD